jgi:hypothetical protein
MINIKVVIIIFLSGFYSILNAQSIIGEWETFDDLTGDKLSVVEIYNINDIYFGKIINLFEDSLDSVCDQCVLRKIYPQTARHVSDVLGNRIHPRG